MWQGLVFFFAITVTVSAFVAKPRAEELAARPIALRSDVVIKGDMVKLGDLFRNVGRRASLPVAYSPEPGREAVLDAEWLAETARRFEIDWRPQSQFDRIVLRRASRTLKSAEVVKRIEARLRERRVDGEFTIKLAARGKTIHLPVTAGGKFAIRDLEIDRRGGRFSARLVAPAERPTVRKRITGRIFRIVSVPVLLRYVRKGSIIRARDVELRKLPRNRVPQNALVDKSELVGRAARYGIRAGVFVRPRDVMEPVLVRRGGLVTLEIRSPVMQLTVRGKALDSGSKGDTVRVRNTKSKRVIEATVVGAGRVKVSLATR